MARMKGRLFFMQVVLLGRALSIEAQQPLVGRIKGVVRDQAKAPVAGVGLTATNLDSGSTRSTVSDTGGAYQFVNLPPGRFSIMAQKYGYRDFTVALVTVASGETVEMAVITLAPRGQKRAAAAWHCLFCAGQPFAVLDGWPATSGLRNLRRTECAAALLSPSAHQQPEALGDAIRISPLAAVLLKNSRNTATI